MNFNPQLIYDFYYTSFLFHEASTNEKTKSSIYAITRNIAENYFSLYKPIIVDQIKKYVKRDRVDKDFPKNEDLNSASLERLNELMNKTFRSDMHRRNNVWNFLTKHIAKLEEIYKNQAETTKIIFEIDRVNNTTHNTVELIFSKFNNYRELQKAFDTCHKVKHYKELEQYTSDSAKNILSKSIVADVQTDKQSINDTRDRMFGGGNFFEPSYVNESKFIKTYKTLLIEIKG